jgi:hypothetical protein
LQEVLVAEMAVKEDVNLLEPSQTIMEVASEMQKGSN